MQELATKAAIDKYFFLVWSKCLNFGLNEVYFFDFTCILMASWNYVIHHTKKQCCGSGFIKSGSGSSISSESCSRFGSRLLMTKNWRRKKLKKIIIFIENLNLLFPRPPKLQEKPSALKRGQPFFCRSFFPPWIRIQSGSATLLWSSFITFSAKRCKERSTNFGIWTQLMVTMSPDMNPCSHNLKILYRDCTVAGGQSIAYILYLFYSCNTGRKYLIWYNPTRTCREILESILLVYLKLVLKWKHWKILL